MSPSRPRNAQATRDAILAAARTLFTQHGFEGVGLREIAAQVGVNASLVNRYFGSKEALFTAAVDAPFDFSTWAEADPRTLATGLVRYILGKPLAEVTGFDPLLMLLRSAGEGPGPRLFQQLVEERFLRPLVARLGPHQADLRARWIAAQLLGLKLARGAVGVPEPSESLSDLEQIAIDSIERVIRDSFATG